MSSRALGVDACKAGWVGVVIDDGIPTVHVAKSIVALVAAAEAGGRPDGKRTWAGAHHRRNLLTGAGIQLGDDIGPAGRHAAVDDVLDAGVAAWTAIRVATGQAQPLPDPPVAYSDGWPAAIWV